MLLNNLINISEETGVNEKTVKELLQNGIIPCVINGLSRKFYYTSDYLVDFAKKRIELSLDKKIDNNRNAFLTKNLTTEIFAPLKNYCEIITISNQKGGVGKTTTAVNLSASLAMLKQRVLILDMDSQSNSSTYFDDEVKSGNSISKLIQLQMMHNKLTRQDVEDVIFTVELDNCSIDILPSELNLGRVLEVARTSKKPELMLTNIIELIKDKYDFIIVDTPPNAGMALEMSLNASKKVAIVAHAKQKAVEGIAIMVEEVEALNESSPEDVVISAIFVNEFKSAREKQIERLADIKEIAMDANIPLEKLYITKEDKIFGDIETLMLPLIDYKKNLNSALHLNEVNFKYAISLINERDM